MAAPTNLPFFIDCQFVSAPRRQSTETDAGASASGTVEDISPDTPRCGVGLFLPRCIQGLASVSTFVGVNSANALMTSILSLYLISQITTIEKEFGLSSSQSGFLLSCNDIGFLMTTLFASYVARKVHIPMVLWLTTLLYGLAGILCSLPYFVSKDAFIRESEEYLSILNTSVKEPSTGIRGKLCVADDRNHGNKTTSCTDNGTSGIGLPNEYTSVAVGLLAVGMIAQGMAKGPRYAFSATYIDDNGSKTKTAMYMGILNGIAVFGPAIAFGAGSGFSRLYVTMHEVPIRPDHPDWVGAWWVGFLMFGTLSLVVATPLTCFPRAMVAIASKEEGSRAKHSISIMGVHAYITGFLQALKRLLKNPVFSLLLSGHVIFSLMIGGSTSFIVKYVETQFFIPTWKANVLLGLLVVVSACLGSVVGGVVVTKKRLSPLSCCKVFTLVTAATGILHCLGYVFGCDTPPFVGTARHGNTLVEEVCWRSCDCNLEEYFPVCGSDGRNYFSPCFAGCKGQIGETYIGCRCVGGTNGTASPGLCDNHCPMLYPYLGMLTVALFLGTFGGVPSFIVLIRCVAEEDKALAVGLSSFAGTLLGLIPGPIIFGKLVDNACLVWTKSCSIHGACALYDNNAFRISKASFDVVPKLVVLVLNVLTLIVARRKIDWSIEESPREVTANDSEVLIKETSISTKPEPKPADS